MKLILRKNDSATSLLLFIYNLHRERTGGESLKLASLLSTLAAFDKNETTVRMALSRAVKGGLLQNEKKGGEVAYHLTDSGRQALGNWNEGAHYFWQRFSRRSQPWAEKWQMISAINLDDKERKADFSAQMQQLGFAQLNGVSWISPYDLRLETEALADGFQLRDHLVSLYGELGGERNPPQWVAHIFRTEELEMRYASFLAQVFPEFIRWRESGLEDDLADGGQALPRLHDLGWRFFSIAADDACLPRQVNPLDKGDQAARLMRDYRQLLLPAAMGFLEQQC